MSGYDFRIRGYSGHAHPSTAALGTLLVETVHKGIGSAQIEVRVWQSRMKKGEVSRIDIIDCRPGGQLTQIGLSHESPKILEPQR